MNEQAAGQVTPEPAKVEDASTQGSQELAAEAVNAEAVKSVEVENKEPVVEKESEAKLQEEITLELPKDSLLDESAVERIAGFAKERGLSKEQAQEILNQQHEAVAQALESQRQRVDQVADAWREQVLKDKEIGGDNYMEKIEVAHRAVKKFASDDFIKALNETKLGNHPELVRVFYRIGLAMNEDRLVTPGAQGGTRYQDPAERLYGKN